MIDHTQLMITIIEQIEIDGQGKAVCSREYNIINNTTASIDLRGIPFKSVLPQNSWTINLHENYYDPDYGKVERKQLLYFQPFNKFGMQEVQWVLEKPYLSPKENYIFQITWETPNIFRRAGTRYIFHYEFQTEQLTPYELIIILPKKKDLLNSNNPSDEGDILEVVKKIFGSVLYETSTPMTRSNLNKRICLKYNDPVSQNKPLDIWVFYFVKIPPFITFSVGLITGLIPNVLWDLLKVSIKKMP